MSKVPNHIAIIMDGNGRWAKAKYLDKTEGHRHGMDAAVKIIEYCYNIGVSYLTLYAFSSENWQRSELEVKALMNLMREYLFEQGPDLVEKGARLSFIGDRSRLAPDLVEMMNALEAESAHNRFGLVFAVSYGSHDEIRAASRKMAQSIVKHGLDVDALPFDYFDQFLETVSHGIPNPDLLIRTGGEQRISNFLLWQLAYTELYFIEKFWPDFLPGDLDQAIEEYVKRDRRYGK